MRVGRRREPLISVVVPVHDVELYLPACLDSLLGQTHRALEIVAVDDGSSDRSGEIADGYAARDARLRVVHTANHGLGAARNEGARHATGDYLAFADSDDIVPHDAHSQMVRELRRTGADLVTGGIHRLEGGAQLEVPWMKRLHAERAAISIDDHPELLGDVFAWNKMFRRDFWDRTGLGWPEGVRYEDQPTTTSAYLAAERIAVLPDIVYQWRIRTDGSSITQQRSALRDLEDRWTTKRMAWRSVEAYGSATVTEVFRDRVLPGDMWRYFLLIPECSDQWWQLLIAGVREFWGERSLVHSGLPPVHRLAGWLVEQDRREDAATVMSQVAALGGQPVRRVVGADGRVRLDPPGLDLAGVDPRALEVRDHER